MTSQNTNINLELLKLTLSFYANPHIQRNAVHFIMNSFILFIDNVFMSYMKQSVQANPLTYNSNFIKDLETGVAYFKDIFDPFDTEYKRLMFYKKENLLDLSEACLIGHVFEHSVVDDEISSEKVDLNGQYISIEWSIRQILETPGAFNLLMNHMEKLYKEKNIKTSFYQSKIWQQKVFEYFDKKIITAFLWQDDCECGNGYGTHAGKRKIGNLCGSLVGFPPELASQLNKIFIVFFGII